MGREEKRGLIKKEIWSEKKIDFYVNGYGT